MEEWEAELDAIGPFNMKALSAHRAKGASEVSGIENQELYIYLCGYLDSAGLNG